jgi:hypothetical protein
MKKGFLFYLFILIGGFVIAGCSNDTKTTSTIATITKKPVVMDPFRFHKLIEVSPGQDYDVLSWGRGSSATGAFEILHSDSAAAKYMTTTGDLNGTIVDVYNSDMDLDGNPEILIQAKGKDTTNYTNIYAFEFSNNKAEKLDFPKLTRSQRQGYKGEDNFYIKEGKLMREFPIYDGSDKDAKPTGQKRQFEYGLRNNSFTVKQLSKDSTITKSNNPTAAKPVVKEQVKNTHTEKKQNSETPKKHKKRHRRHHHSDNDDE